jgi:hypothetical protein
VWLVHFINLLYYFQKTFISDHLTKKKRENSGQLPQYLVKNNHEAVINSDTFSAVQSEIARRAKKHQPQPKAPASYPFTGLIKCGICGASYRRKIAGSEQKYKKVVWICGTFNTLGKSFCASQMIPEDVLMALAAEFGVENIESITIPGAFKVVFLLKDGAAHERTWRHPSRRESWTPEMRETVRQKNFERRKEGKK